ncbi:hypothetical protein ABIF86_000933 [Bradyrhizobium japonicum]
MSALPANTLTEAIVAIEDVSSRIEDVFARVGHELGRGHLIFKELNQGLATLSEELSGAEIEGAATALQEIAARLSELAEALPAESALLATIGTSTAEASALLKPLFKHIQMITIIARSARIEAASLDGDREGFLAFTQEAYDLGKAVQGSIESCARDQQRLSEAVATASGRQREFESRYRSQLVSESAELGAAYSGLRGQRRDSSQLADLASTSTRKIAEAVGGAIISLQAGDSTRQRLEHVCHGLGQASEAAPGLVPERGASEDGARARSANYRRPCSGTPSANSAATSARSFARSRPSCTMRATSSAMAARCSAARMAARHRSSRASSRHWHMPRP